MLDKDGSGEITFLEATKFLEKSKRNLRASDAIGRKTQQKQIENEVRKIFAMVDIDHTKKISADEFIAVYTNVFCAYYLIVVGHISCCCELVK